MAGLYPLSRMQQFDSNGRPLSGARLFLYDGGTSTPRTGYKDSSLTSAHPNPILADSAGRLPLVYLDDGFYRQRLTSRTGTLVFDDDGIPVLSSTEGGSGTSVDPESVFKTGNIKIDFGHGAIDGYVRANGRSIGSASSGATERANADTEPLFTKLWAYANISVTGGKGANAAADFAANKPLVLPNCQGVALFGMPDMGGTGDSAFAALLTGTPDEPGATGGADTVTLAEGNLPAHAHAVHLHDPGHNHSYVTPGFSADVASGGDGRYTQQSTTTTFSSTTGITVRNQAGGAGTANITATAGSGTAVNKLPSLLTVMIYIRL